MMRACVVNMTRRDAAPWCDERTSKEREVKATMIGAPKAMPDGSEVALVTYGEQPHWTTAHTVEVWGIVTRDDALDVWRDAGMRGARADFGVLDAQTWRDRLVDRAWARARGGDE